MRSEIENKKLPLHKRIVFWLVLPVVIVGIAISGVMIGTLSPPIESFLIEQFEANLRLASKLGVGVCDTRFNQLLDMQLQDNLEMNEAMKKQALEEIESIGGQVPNVHILVLEDKQSIKTISNDFPQATWKLPAFSNTEDAIMDFRLGEERIKAHVRYFTSWNWHIISFVNEKDYLAPISTAHQIIYLSTMGVLVAVFVTLLFMLHHSVTKPLDRLIVATKDVSRGKLQPVDPIRDNEIGQLMAFFNSMVESLKTKTEEVSNLIDQLKESEQRYRSLYQNAQVGLGRTRISDGKVLECNKKMAQIFGYDSTEKFAEEYVFSERYVDKAVRKKMLVEIEKSGVIHNIEAQFYKKDGRTIWVRFDTRIFPERGYMEDVIMDLAEQKKAEEERKKLQIQLQQAQKMESIGTLAGGIAHDFNNILTPIIVHSEMAMMELPLDNPIQFNLKQIYKAGERARDMVKQILAFGRQKEPEKLAIKMGFVIKEAVKLLRSSIPSTIDISHNIETEEDTIFADPTQIHQVVLNLCTNASHTMREKGGMLKIELDELDLDSDAVSQFTGLNPGSYVGMTVSDTGEGIDPEVLDRIFEPYFTTKGPGEGTGMGLAAAHGIVRNHGGDIICKSEVGKGTTFRLLFPKYEGEVAEDSEGIVRLHRGTERILFVDDEKAAVNAIKPMLENFGYHVTGRTSSIEALEAFRNKPGAFDLVITDQTMPNMTGKDLAVELMSISPDTPIILCTGFSDQIDERSAKEMGISAFIMKPIVMRQIAQTIREVLDEIQ